MSSHDYDEHHSYDNDAYPEPEPTPAQAAAARVAYMERFPTDTAYKAHLCVHGYKRGDHCTEAPPEPTAEDLRRVKRAKERTRIVAEAKAKNEAARRAEIADRQGVIG